MGVELTLSTKVVTSQIPQASKQSHANHSLRNSDRYYSSSEVSKEASQYLHRNIHSAFWQRTELEYTFSHAISLGDSTKTHSQTQFRHGKAPSHSPLERLVHNIRHRIAHYLEKVGPNQRDMDNTYLDLPIDGKDNSLLQLQAASASYRIALGKLTGKKSLLCKPYPHKTKITMVI